jgi:uncharacterized protein (TIGR03435 family)
MPRVVLLLAFACCAFSQPRFEVATIKPVRDDAPTGGVYTGHGRMKADNVTLKRLVMGAYHVGPAQVAGGPPWLDTERFNIVAKSPQDINDDDVLDTMVQALLAERFQLELHRESRPMPAYVIEIAKSGPKLEKSPGGQSSVTYTLNTLLARNTGMDRFAYVLSRSVNLPVANRTGLEGIFNFQLRWEPDSERSRPDAGPSLFTAIQEQLGLRLRAEKAPVEVLVIDRAEHPTEN